jgi:hypothetical protein
MTHRILESVDRATEMAVFNLLETLGLSEPASRT